MTRFIWTDEAVALLRVYGSKISARGIAIMLGTSRNSVISKARRCGIALRDRSAAAHCDEANARRRASLRASFAAKRAAISAAAR